MFATVRVGCEAFPIHHLFLQLDEPIFAFDFVRCQATSKDIPFFYKLKRVFIFFKCDALYCIIYLSLAPVVNARESHKSDSVLLH